MRLSVKSLEALCGIITGDKQLSPYRKGSQLVELFNRYGFEDFYDKDFPSRKDYTIHKLDSLNDTPQLSSVICEVLHPREYLEFDGGLCGAINYINSYFEFDGYQISLKGYTVAVNSIAADTVEIDSVHISPSMDLYEFIDEQIDKADSKMQAEGFDGAITNARSLLEAVLRELELRHCETVEDYGGDLPRMYKRVSKSMCLDPARKDLESSLKQVLSGLTSIVHGISAASNKMSDRHAQQYRPNQRHARLVVNSSKTVTTFLLETSAERLGKLSKNL